MVELSGKCF